MIGEQTMPKAFEITETRQEKGKKLPLTSAGSSSKKADLDSITHAQDILHDSLRTLVGDLTNQRSHLSDELGDLREDSLRKERGIYLSFLDVMDSIDRLIRLIDPANEVAGSLNVLRTQFLQLLQDREVSPTDVAPGQVFDVDTCEVSGRLERPDLPDGTIISVERRGYAWRSRTLRRARVTISTNPKGA